MEPLDRELRAVLAAYRDEERMSPAHRAAAWSRLADDLAAPAASPPPAARRRLAWGLALLAAAAVVTALLRPDRLLAPIARDDTKAQANHHVGATPPTDTIQRTPPATSDAPPDTALPPPPDRSLAPPAATSPLDPSRPLDHAATSPLDASHRSLDGSPATSPLDPSHRSLDATATSPLDLTHRSLDPSLDATATSPLDPSHRSLDATATSPLDPSHRALDPSSSSATPRDPAAPLDPRAFADLEQELALLRDARAAAPADALRILDEHARRFPSGHLLEERELLRVRALCAVGEGDAARRRAAAFAAAHPTSPHARRIHDTCPEGQAPHGSAASRESTREP